MIRVRWARPESVPWESPADGLADEQLQFFSPFPTPRRSSDKCHLCGDEDNVCVKERNKRPEVIAEPKGSIRLLSKAGVPAIAKGNLGAEKAHFAGSDRARTPGRAHAVPIFPVIRKGVQRRSWLCVAARSWGGNGLTAFRGPFIGHGMWLDHTVVDTGIPKAASGGRFSACLCSGCSRECFARQPPQCQCVSVMACVGSCPLPHFRESIFRLSLPYHVKTGAILSPSSVTCSRRDLVTLGFQSNGWKQARSGNSQMLGEDSAKRLSKPFEPRGGQTRRSNGGDVMEGPLMSSKLQVDWPMRETRK
ncbi:hypothetical protein CNYM01_02352 [Colletotrichum nymphaeae SA-01]|uniref:Uncharacterized protein n=1 Tax=Colletotrichum nymphaeae SA-01 TaxID=1460502 RepID=A0A135UNT9_9PEZI|nr:hypothetical protein CNYM01_02352 [Colletotrichum nymphaeae SA-01]